MSSVKAKKPPKKYSSDRRVRMRELQAEGKLGPQHGKLGGRPRKSSSDGQQRRRAATVIAEKARENSDKIAQVFIDCLLDDDASRADKLRAVKAMVGIDLQESDRERDELADPSSAMSQSIATDIEEAKGRLAGMLNDPITGERMRAALAGVLAEAGSTSTIASSEPPAA